MRINVDRYMLDINSELDITDSSPSNINFELKSSDMFKTIKINEHELMTCYESNDGLFLHHLDSPEDNKGFGQLGLAVFYVIAKIKRYTKFTMKFGGGEQSKQFLLKVGFKEENIKLVQDTDYQILRVRPLPQGATEGERVGRGYTR